MDFDISMNINKDINSILLSANDIRRIINTCKRQKPSILETNPLCKRINTAQNVIELFIERLPELLKQYNDALVKRNMCFSEKELLSKNRIDVRNLCLKTEKPHEIPDMLKNSLTDDETEFLKNNSFYALIPCYEEGVLQINTNRYIYFKTINLDIANDTVILYLQDYIKYDGIYRVGISATVDNNFIDTGIINSVQYHDLYKKIPAKTFNWSEVDKLIWQINTSRSQTFTEKLATKGIDLTINLVTVFFKAITKTNYELSLHKPSRGKKENKQTNKRTIIADTTANQSEKLIRTVGPIMFKSEKPPRKPSEETLVHYRLASWKTRGHLRTYKNGKTVYVRESTHKRKCLQNTEPKTPQTILRFKKGKDI